jgi:Ferritin-like
MPVPEFEWKSYRVPADAGDPQGFARALAAEAPDEVTIEVNIPDLSQWPQPIDKAKVLLATAAEIEHALLVQYLYAAFSLKTTSDVAVQQTALNQWSAELHSIAHQEMGHLVTVQNLLLAIGAPPNLEREALPSIKDLYPFKFKLEPLTQRSLAKYVTAEAPLDAPNISDISAQAQDKEGMPVNHVGNIYALLGVVFSTHQEIVDGGSDQAWNDHLRTVAKAAYKQDKRPEAWHLDDSVIDNQTLTFQAAQADWDRGEPPEATVHQIKDRAVTARDAIRDIAEQGEGPISGGTPSHFDRFLAIYRGGGSPNIEPFPAAGQWNPTLPVPENPTPPATAPVTASRTDRWAHLADLRYSLLLGFIEQYLRTSATTDRANLSTNWALNGEMFTLASLAETLATLPQNGGVAALPFTLPDILHMPATENDRWRLLRARTQQSIDHVQAMQVDSDTNDGFLKDLLSTDAGRLTQMPATTGFARDVRPLFRQKDIDHMKPHRLDLTNYDAVKAQAKDISAKLKGIGVGQPMPPPPDPPLSPDQIALFDAWRSEGCPP